MGFGTCAPLTCTDMQLRKAKLSFYALARRVLQLTEVGVGLPVRAAHRVQVEEARATAGVLLPPGAGHRTPNRHYRIEKIGTWERNARFVRSNGYIRPAAQVVPPVGAVIHDTNFHRNQRRNFCWKANHRRGRVGAPG